ncbi:hypothetical protein COB64_03980 [Candidatus Wolfebacteria bacterium]|nr:MAG: hypothetical protein COB64_03980 [Candidatus Wolfebacteria bacterium]
MRKQIFSLYFIIALLFVSSTSGQENKAIENRDLSESIVMKWWNQLPQEWQRLFVQKANMSYPLNLKQVERLGRLGGFDCNGAEIATLKPLSNLTWLTYINCSNTKITTLEPLKHLRKLDRLIIDSTDIDDLSPIENLESLTFLRLINTNVPRDDIIAFIKRHPGVEVQY